MACDWVFHHVGLAASDFLASVEILCALGFKPEGPEFEDPIQGVRGLFLTLGGSRVEVISNLAGSATVDSWTHRQSLVPYHLAYLVPNLDLAIQQQCARGLRLVRAPAPAVAFSGRRIAFLSSRSKFLVEIVESGMRNILSDGGKK